MDGWMEGWMDGCMYVIMYVGRYVCMYVCIMCMHACMYILLICLFMCVCVRVIHQKCINILGKNCAHVRSFELCVIYIYTYIHICIIRWNMLTCIQTAYILMKMQKHLNTCIHIHIYIYTLITYIHIEYMIYTYD